MSNLDALLLSNKVLEGPRRVTSNLRPPRTAFLVEFNNPISALAAITCCTLSWGGALQLIIPCHTDGEPEGVWAFMLDLHDPDEIVDMVGASESFIESQKEALNRVVLRWDLGSKKLHTRGATVFSPLRHLKNQGELIPQPRCLRLDSLASSQFALPLAFRWGYLGDGSLTRISYFENVQESVSHEDFVTLEPIEPSNLEPSDVVQLLTEPMATRFSNALPIMAQSLPTSLLELTLANTGGQSTFQERLELGPEERQYGQMHNLCPVVVGSAASVPDLCLAWNLRSKRPGIDPFPIWVEPAWLTAGLVTKQLDRARQEARGRWIHKEIDPWLGLVSASLSENELSELVELTHRAILVDERRFKDLLPIRLQVGLERESIAEFRAGQADVVLPELKNVGQFYQGESIGISVDIEGWKSPKTGSPRFRSTEEIIRTADDGIAGEVALWRRKNYDLIRVRLNSSWQVVTQVAKQAGYAVEISDKGRQAIAILKLIEDPRDLSILASSKIYALLRDMSRIVPRQAVQQTLRRIIGREPLATDTDAVVRALESSTIEGGQFERPHYDWSRLKDSLGVGGQDATWLVEWLVRCRFLFRGFQLNCPECGLPRWYPVDRIATIHLCDGCQTSMPLPVAVDKPLIWRYRLNEVVALGVDQGVLPHLLAARRIREWGYRMDARLLGMLPGLVFIPLNEDGPPKIEVDLFAIHEGRVIVGECKANGSELSISEIERFAALGKRLDSAAIIYATPTTFDEVGETVALSKSLSAPVDIDLWEMQDMLDPRPFGGASQQDPVEYLTGLIAWRKSELD